MDNCYTIEGKYLQAVHEYFYGETSKSLQLLQDIIEEDPLHARAYYQLGVIYYFNLLDYQSAGYYFQTCVKLEPEFPDVYEIYIHLLGFLNMQKALNTVKDKALNTPGVNKASVWNMLGMFAEKNNDLKQAKSCYKEGVSLAVNKRLLEEIKDNLERVKTKLRK